MNKTAVDQKASDYWVLYFKDYGESFVRTIPRRIKTALLNKFSSKIIEGTVAPLANDVSKYGVISVEAAFKGKLDGVDASALVVAEFSPDGKLRKFDAYRLT